MTLEHSGEMVVAADYLGVPHNPGYPLWTVLAWFFHNQRPALTCFEKAPEECHRFWVVQALLQRFADCPPVHHL